LDYLYLTVLRVWQRMLQVAEASEGFTTAELLGNAALAIVVLIAIWAALKAMGLDIIAKIHTDLINQL
jgi:hypothetical protein